MPDSLIAATALIHGCELATLNTKDFKYIDGLMLANYPLLHFAAEVAICSPITDDRELQRSIREIVTTII